jgi:hypothetical protein
MTNKAKYCFTPVNQGNEDYRVAKVIRNKSGYYPLGKADTNDPHELDKFVGDYNHAKFICDTWNNRLGISAEEEMQIVASTMGGQ